MKKQKSYQNDYKRTDRLNSMLRAEIGRLLHSEVRDPRLGEWVTIVEVESTSDLFSAKVFYITHEEEAVRLKEIQQTLVRVSPFLRKKIGQNLRVRRAPELRFILDESFEYAHRIDQVLETIRKEDADDQHPDDGHSDDH